jgi:hypothetical protein
MRALSETFLIAGNVSCQMKKQKNAATKQGDSIASDRTNSAKEFSSGQQHAARVNFRKQNMRTTRQKHSVLM